MPRRLQRSRLRRRERVCISLPSLSHTIKILRHGTTKAVKEGGGELWLPEHLVLSCCCCRLLRWNKKGNQSSVVFSFCLLPPSKEQKKNKNKKSWACVILLLPPLSYEKKQTTGGRKTRLSVYRHWACIGFLQYLEKEKRKEKRIEGVSTCFSVSVSWRGSVRGGVSEKRKWKKKRKKD